tara:strand:- start:2031 stop:3635 length:1605 start_codon:yes stop_codon:yes gene_type:complete
MGEKSKYQGVWDILVVDHNLVDREVVRRSLALSKMETRFREASDLDQARRALHADPASCVLVDLSLPDGEGLELISEFPTLPFIVYSGRDDEPTTRRARDAGAYDYLIKGGLAQDSIERAIRYAMERKAHQSVLHRLANEDRLASLGRLAASAAHEISTPIAYVSANLSVLSDSNRQVETLLRELGELKDPRVDALIASHPVTRRLGETHRLIDDSNDGLAHITSLVGQMRSFARQPDAKEPPTTIDLNAVVNGACRLTGHAVSVRARVERTLAPRLPRVVGRSGELTQVVANLLMNAAQAVELTVPRKRIWVQTRVREGAVELVVDDEGPGFSEKAKLRAFDPFFTTKPSGEGTGLGLAIAGDIVEGHGGSIHVEDRPGGGARIQVVLPAAAQRVSGVMRKLPTPEEDGHLKLLLIEDDELLREALSRVLRPHEVLATTAEEALEAIDRGREFDAIFCDLMMPHVDGQAVYRYLEEHHPHLLGRMVLMSGGAVDDRMRSFVRTIDNPMVRKPANRATLLEAARRASRRPQRLA